MTQEILLHDVGQPLITLRKTMNP